MSTLSSQDFAGLAAVVNDDGSFQHDDIADDLEGERETLPDLSVADFEPLEDSEGSASAMRSQWSQTIEGASKCVSDTTEKGYQRSVPFCIPFCIEGPIDVSIFILQPG